MDKRQEDKRSKRRQLYGRRQGHKLSPRQKLLMKNLLPRLGVLPDSRINRPDGSQSHQAIDLDLLFPQKPGQICLEVGFGAGEHLIRQAQAHDNSGFIGCEPFINGMAKALRDIEKFDLENIRLHHGDARDVLDALPASSLECLFILYPDPWPKKRHHKRRFMNDENIARFARTLKPGAKLLFASDIPDYVCWTLIHMDRSKDFIWTAERPDDWRRAPQGWQSTRYEVKALREGRSPAYLTFRRV